MRTAGASRARCHQAVTLPAGRVPEALVREVPLREALVREVVLQGPARAGRA